MSKRGYIRLKQSRSKSGQFTGYSDAELYERYTEDYEKSELKLAKRGDTMYVDKLNRDEFNAILVQSRNDGRKVGAKFVDDLVADSEYKISRKAAQASAKAFREYAKAHLEFAEIYGTNIQSWEFRQGLGKSERAQGWFEEVTEIYHLMRDIGYSGKKARKEISHLMYGSPK